jgi:hypothetical protein
MLDRHEAEEKIRQNQQGLGRPIIAAKVRDQQVVAVRNRLLWSPKWKTFPDFLGDYIKLVMDPAWGNAEIAKPIEQRHPLMQWYDHLCRYQQATIKTPGEVTNSVTTGIVACYLGLAYNLYLLEHNVELQERLVRRLKDPGNFQGAYYELMVAGVLVRAGFTLTLEDETDTSSKHCEFAAVSPRTNTKYWVEAKMRSVAGYFGKTAADGTSDANPISRLIPHLNAALAKPAADERLIFIDLNTEPDRAGANMPAWADLAVKRLEQYEQRELAPGVHAYVFVTNIAFHRALAEPAMAVGLPFGLSKPDFNRPGEMRLSEAHRRRQKHIDAYCIGETFSKVLTFPVTFDGRMPSETFGERSHRPLIGETYVFTSETGDPLIGTVTAASVIESEPSVVLGVTGADGMSRLLRRPMRADELADYKANPEAYFGRVVPVARNSETKYDLFQWLMQVNKSSDRAKLLEHLANFPDFEALKTESDDQLLAVYCEAMVGQFERSGLRLEDGKHREPSP